MIKITAVQGALKYLDLTGTLSRMQKIPEGAADNRWQLIAFPEVYIAGHLHWVWLERPCIGQKLFPVLHRNAVRIPGPAITVLSRMARQFRLVMAVGVNEVEPDCSGTIYMFHQTPQQEMPYFRAIREHRNARITHTGTNHH